MQVNKLFLLLIVVTATLFSCRRDRKDVTPDPSIQKALEKLVDGGSLLNSYTLENNVYVFRFETEEVRIPADQIGSIQEQKDRWKTTVTLRSGAVIAVPSKGTDLGFMVETVTLNPSGYNPLAAVAELRLPATGRIQVTVVGKEGSNGTITHLCQSSIIRQDVPILGLYPNYNNTVILTFTDKDGKPRGSTQIRVQTAPLPVQGFPVPEKIVAQPGKMEPGVNLVSYPGESEADISAPYMVDADGEIRWVLLLKQSPGFQRFGASIGLKRTKNGHFISGDGQLHRIVELDMFGKLLRQWDLAKLGYTFHHEVTEAANGNFLITVSKSSARLASGKPRVNDFIIELNPVNGTVVKEWDLTTMMDSSRYEKTPDGSTPGPFAQSAGNWAHNNSIAEHGGHLLMTMRYQGIASFTAAGAVKWILSPHKGWGEKYRKFLLKPVNEQGALVTDQTVIDGEAPGQGFEWSWGPHTPVSLPNGNILVFDNGYNRHWIPNAQTQNYSRAVEYKIDESKGTVQQVRQYGKSRGAAGFSQALSGVQYLKSTGHIMFCPGMGVPTAKGFGGRVVEVDPATGEVIFELEITAPSGTAFHRVTRLSLYPDNL
ncbi:aryl-sulfate sulfotransferase [Chitinophaga deserti]|uniref:aryl-sulfate sulfotransferase n=1 Tax=Chitinophaga deserti TaxID=2164099 RepID=UPI000D6BBE2A|nr:aryl-sulfate sulfotransferase [Chitinophaga deserti]